MLNVWMVYGSSMDGLKFPDPSRSKTHGVFFPSHVSNLRHGCLYLSPILLPEKMQDIYAGDHLYDLYIHGGTYLKKRGCCPWDYSDAPLQVNGVIRLDYAPLWFLTGLFYEKRLKQ